MKLVHCGQFYFDIENISYIEINAPYDEAGLRSVVTLKDGHYLEFLDSDAQELKKLLTKYQLKVPQSKFEEPENPETY